MQNQSKKSPLSCENRSSSKKFSSFKKDYLHDVIKQKNLDYFDGHKKVNKKQKKKKKFDKEQFYSGCRSMKKLNSIAETRSQQIIELVKIRQKLLQTNRRLKFFVEKPDVERQGYFLEEIEGKKLEIKWLKQKMSSKGAEYEKQVKKIKKEIGALNEVIEEEQKNRKFYLHK